MDERRSAGNAGRARLALLLASRFVTGFIAIGAMLFLPAWSLAWVRGWLYLGLIACLMALALSYFLVRDPELLRKRMQLKEKRGAQRRCVALSYFIILPIFVVPGLDWRFGWSAMPSFVPWAGLAAAAAGYALFLAVLRANSYASRLIEVQAGQKVIDTGPYAVVRHPMYVSSALIYLASPLALGSWWALIPALAYLPLLAYRILDEEAMLRQGLPGYEAYCAKLRWRLVPGLW